MKQIGYHKTEYLAQKSNQNMGDRRRFLKELAMVSAAAVVAPDIVAKSSNESEKTVREAVRAADDFMIVERKNALPITGTFLDEISHDIPHQNWGVRSEEHTSELQSQR